MLNHNINQLRILKICAYTTAMVFMLMSMRMIVLTGITPFYNIAFAGIMLAIGKSVRVPGQ